LVPSAKRSCRRRFQPGTETLEGRALLSSVTAQAPAILTSVETRTRSQPIPNNLTLEPASQVVRLSNRPFSGWNGRRLLLDIYQPAGPPPPEGRPAVLAIHGGGWRRYSKEHYGPRSAVLAGAGFVVVAPNYTLSRPGRPSWPASLEDLRAAVRWVRSHSAEYGIHPDQIAAIGESAGGHLAELLGTAPEAADGSGVSSRVRAVVAMAGPSDLGRLVVESQEGAGVAVSQFLGGSRRRLRLRYVQASPIHHVSPDDPPMLLIHGQWDRLVPPIQSRRMADALRSAGVPHRLVLVPADHRLDFQVGGRNLTPDIVAFLRQALME
jgi:acetyl esterase/lipase